MIIASIICVGIVVGFLVLGLSVLFGSNDPEADFKAYQDYLLRKNLK